MGVQNAEGVDDGTTVHAEVLIRDEEGRTVSRSDGWKVAAGIPPFVAGDASLKTHESPEWFDGAKFGLFVHWGTCAVVSKNISY